MGRRWAGASIGAALIAALCPLAVVSVEPAAAKTLPARAITSAPTSSAQPPRIHVRRHQDEAQFQRAKAGANAVANRFVAPSAAAPASLGALASVYSGNNFSGLSAGSVTPSDSTGDASPTQQVEMVNSKVAVFPDTCGSPCGGPPSVPLYILAAASPSDCVFDPQVAWDQQWGRWIYSMVVQQSNAIGGCTGSKNANITGDKLVFGWTYTSDANDFLKYNVCLNPFDTGSDLMDFQKLGHDDNSLIIGANVFSNYGKGPFTNSVVWMFAKPQNVSASTPCGIGGRWQKLYSLGSSVFTPVPAAMTDSSSVGYVVVAQVPGAGPANNLLLYQSSFVSGNASLTFMGYLGVAPYGVPPNVPQPATGTASCSTAGNCLDSGDSRLTQAIGHFDPDTGAEAVWTQHAISDPRYPARSIERWYEIIPVTLAVRQSGNVSDPNLHIFNGAVSPTVAGNEAVLFYNAGSAAVNGFVSYRAQSRNRLLPLGTMSSESVLAASTVNDTDFSCGASQTPPVGNLACRWGDYSAARPDPSNVNAAWGVGMLTGSGGSPTSAGWATQVAEVTPGCSAVSISGASTGATNVLFTASAASGCSNPVYQFWLQAPNGYWQIVQPFTSGNVWNWDTSAYRPGPYKIIVWANQYGDSPASAESSALIQWSIPYCVSEYVTANVMSSVTSGTQVTLMASSSCPNPSPNYQFWMLPPGGPWSVVQPYSTSATFNWNTTGYTPGNYHFSVWVRDATSSGAFGMPPNTYDAYAALDLALQPVSCTGMSASATPASTAAIGTDVSVTGAATGCPNPRYQFWLLPPGGSWTVVQPWSASSTYSWNTNGMPAGSYRFSVWARDVSSTSPYDVFSAFQYSLTVVPCMGMAASSTPTSTTSVGTTVTIGGSASGCPNPRYQFWLLPPGGSWTVVQAYSTRATFTWNTFGSSAGAYRFSVWSVDASSSASYDSFSAFPYTLTLAPCTGMSVSQAPPSTATVGTTVTITGAATGCPNAQYQFWLLPPGGTWTVVQPYSNAATFTWNTAGLPAGSYRFSVWARDASSSGSYDAFSAFPYTLT